jgi:D-alanine-D-alanine ligase-like ATP-grasp enzyme
MKITLLKPAAGTPAVKNKIEKISALLDRLGYEVTEQDCNAGLFAALLAEPADVVFNLASIYGWEKTNLVPAVLEIAAVRYTGAGMLGLSLARNYSKLFPLLSASGLRVPPYRIIEAGSPPAETLNYPLNLYRDGAADSKEIRNRDELSVALAAQPAGQEIVLQERVAGERESLYLLDGQALFGVLAEPYPALAGRAFALMETRGLARFDFIKSDPPLLDGIEIAPDPVDEKLLQAARCAGWDEGRLLQALVEHAGSDRAPRPAAPILQLEVNHGFSRSDLYQTASLG